MSNLGTGYHIKTIFLPMGPRKDGFFWDKKKSKWVDDFSKREYRSMRQFRSSWVYKEQRRIVKDLPNRMQKSIDREIWNMLSGL